MTRHGIARLAVVAALFLGAATATAQRILADFSGAWSVTVDGPQGAMYSQLTLKQTGDSISGEFQSDIGTAPVVGLAKGDTLKLAFGIDMNGQALSLQWVGTLKDADNIGGSVEAVGMGAFPFVAARKK